MTTPIDIRADQLRIVHDVLARHLPDGVRVWVFGSRATWATKDSSDLDLALEGDGEIPACSLAALESAFEDSDLPFAVDVVDAKRIGEEFKEIVAQQRVRFPESDASSGARTNPARRVSLRNLCDAIVDCPHSTPKWTPDGVIVLRSKNIRDGRLDLSQPSYTSEKDYAQRVRRATPRAGDLVITREAPMGEVCMIPEGLRCCLGQRMVLLRPSLVAADSRYLLYALQSEPVQQEIRSHDGTGSTVSNLRISLLEGLRIPGHPLSEQRAIAHILGALDDKIELNRRMNAMLEAMARALFRSWFVDFDPVRAKLEGRDTGLPKDVADLFPDRLVNSELGEIPEGWELKSLDAVARFQNGLALQKFRPLQNEARLPVVKIAQLRAGEVNSGEWASASIQPECVIEDGDVVFSWSGSLLVRTWCGGRAALNQHLFKVTSEKYPKWFYLHCLLSHFPEFQRIAADKATTMGHIKRHHLADAVCVAPPDRVITRVSALLGGLLERRVANEVASRTLMTLRDALLPKLVSGEMPVRNAEKIVGAIA